MKIKKLLAISLFAWTAAAEAQSTASYSGNVIADEGAWCWFADPRATHYKNSDGSINSAYIGYIDVHGAIKSSQISFTSDGNVVKKDVLVRSRFQPDDHNNPTFLVLPDERVVIFYARHTDDPRFYYRISKKKGDITELGEEHEIKVANNTTYPSPFILSDDPEHIYLCWRGINWHPTIAKLSLPDENDNISIEWGPYQMVQSTGARPYAKYQSNGKDKIYVAYTTGHPDNEYPNWLYFNVINLNAEKDADGTVKTNIQLADLNGKTLSTIQDGVFKVSKTGDYKTAYPGTIIDSPSNYRDWVWQIVLDEKENPVVAMVKISNDKNSHEYYYARWNGKSWKLTDLANGGGRFHSSNTEYCYSGGMSLDPDNVNDVYLSIPTENTITGSKVYEIWKYTVDEDGSVSTKKQITYNSTKNNVRPFILPGSADSDLRLCWMNGDYYYWLVRTGYPLGYPTAIHADFDFPTEEFPTLAPDVSEVWNRTMDVSDTRTMKLSSNENRSFTYVITWSIDHDNYGGVLLQIGNMEYGVDAASLKPYVKIGDTTYSSQSILGTSDAWATESSGTDGKWYLTKLGTFTSAFTYDNESRTLTVYRNGWIDQCISGVDLTAGDCVIGGYKGRLISGKGYSNGTSSQSFIRWIMTDSQMEALHVPSEVYSDIVLPATISGGKAIRWTSSNEDALSSSGTVKQTEEAVEVTLQAEVDGIQRKFSVTVMPRDISKNQLLEYQSLDFTGNTVSGFSSNKYEVAPSGILDSLRSYTVLLTTKAKSLDKAPRFYDFGSGSGNSVFLRANPLSAGIKYNGATTTLVTGATALETDKEYRIAVTFDATTHTTKIYIEGEEDASGGANITEPYQLAQVAPDTRNYIGRTQWWATSYATDNADFCGTISAFKLFNTALTREEICKMQGIEYKEKEYPTSLINGDFEEEYEVMPGSGVNSDRAIYVPEGWAPDYSNPNNYDLTAMAAGDLYYSDFFASHPQPENGGEHTYWVRQKWGTSTISFYQELKLLEGEYVLTADVWKSGLGGNAFIYVDNGKRSEVSPEENKEAWQKVKMEIHSNGNEIAKVGFSAVHTSGGSEKIIGFDNIKIEQDVWDGIQSTPDSRKQEDTTLYDLTGRRTRGKTTKGIYKKRTKNCCEIGEASCSYPGAFHVIFAGAFTEHSCDSCWCIHRLLS